MICWERSQLMCCEKIAQNIGLSRLGNETGSRRYPPEWRSSICREVARRVWWNLVGFISSQSSWLWTNWTNYRWSKIGPMQWLIRALTLFTQRKTILHFLQISMTPIWQRPMSFNQNRSIYTQSVTLTFCYTL